MSKTSISVYMDSPVYLEHLVPFFSHLHIYTLTGAAIYTCIRPLQCPLGSLRASFQQDLLADISSISIIFPGVNEAVCKASQEALSHGKTTGRCSGKCCDSTAKWLWLTTDSDTRRSRLWTASLDNADGHRSMDRAQHSSHDSIDLSHDIQLPVLIS